MPRNPLHVALQDSPYALRPSVFLGALLMTSGCLPLSPTPQDVSHPQFGQRQPLIEQLASTATVELERARNRELMDSLSAAAIADCEADICAGVTRGESLLGMSETQLYAATKSVPTAWTARRTGLSTVLVAASLAAAPRDLNGHVALVEFDRGRAILLGYREPSGLRVVTRRAIDVDAAYATAREADVELHPVEALLRYQHFLQLAERAANGARRAESARLAEAVATAKQRIAVLEKQTK